MDTAVRHSSPAVRAGPRPRPGALSNLLLLVAALVFAMVVIGGITRLTESGLSITEWNVVSGTIPPLSHADWVHEFALYKQTPQYQQVAGPAGMTLAGFKFKHDGPSIQTPPPALGQHTDEVLASVGYSKADIEAMRKAGADA